MTSCWRIIQGLSRILLLRRRNRVVTAIVLTFILLYLFRQTLLLAGRDFFYVTRPLWDSPTLPSNRITHFYAPNIEPEKLCALHNWAVRRHPPRVFDAFIFSIELDMLEIRLKHLWDVVDIFVIVEASRTFTGREKRLIFKENKERFSWAEHKIRHFIIGDLSANPKKSFDNEAKTRRDMSRFIDRLDPDSRDLIIVGDVDELPYTHTIQLLKSCQGYSPELHLELQDYVYSFEFRLQTIHWRQHVATYDRHSFSYHHGKNDTGWDLLADSGWHCSFCFRHISDFVFKMRAYSHSDRVTKDDLLKKENIQRKICDGSDIYDMLPEAYSFKDIISQWGKAKRILSTVGLPEYVVQNPDKFRFLLPGGCLRENSTDEIMLNREIKLS